MNQIQSQPRFFQRAAITALFLLMTFLILTHSRDSLYFALNSLNLWFTKMVPSLLPFMILSGIMVRMQLTESFAAFLYPLLHPLFRVQKNVIYAMVMGFLCGFPMGARVTCELLERGKITEAEGEFLLAFCNNIGPVYVCGFVLPLLHRRLLWPYLLGMYGLPFLYGLFLRHTLYRKKLSWEPARKGFSPDHRKAVSHPLTAGGNSPTFPSLLEQIDDSVFAGIQGILMLGGYMILFNLFNLIPLWGKELAAHPALRPLLPGRFAAFLQRLPTLLAPLWEITGGLGLLGDSAPLLSLVLLPFGGLCCIAQTRSTIRRTSLSISCYVLHKLLLTGITLACYGLWALLSPATFLS